MAITRVQQSTDIMLDTCGVLYPLLIKCLKITLRKRACPTFNYFHDYWQRETCHTAIVHELNYQGGNY